ncbi:MarR family winged helix-turn-helix transcriptional regulator, partial [Streptomyces paradoxus]
EPSNLTGIVDKLETRGLLERQPDPGDRRVKILAITDTGREMAEDLLDRLRFAREPLAALDENQRRDLCDLLQLMADT